MIYAASFAVAFLLVAASYARGLAAAEQEADDRTEAHNRLIGEMRADLSAGERRISEWKRAAEIAMTEAAQLRSRVQQLERRLVKFNHTIDPTAAELALERVQRAREQHDTARAEWQRVRQETK